MLMGLVELLDGPALERGVKPTSADARSRTAPRDEDQAAEALAEARTVRHFHEVHERVPASRKARRPRRTFSGVIGSEVIRTPTASYTALAMAPAVGEIGASLPPLAPNGPFGS